MRRTFIALSLAAFACQAAPQRSDDASKSRPAAENHEPAERDRTASAGTKKVPFVRKDLFAEDLPPVPTLEQTDFEALASGELGFPEGTDELAPRAALALSGGLLLAGQAYLDRQPGAPPQSWRWTGFVPTEGEARSTLHDHGAIRAGIVHDGVGLLTGTRGTGWETRGWFAKVTADGTVIDEVALDTPNTTEMFDLVPGRTKGERVVLGGYVDAQGYLISLDAAGQRRWEKYIGSYGYTQVRALARLDGGELLTVGTRAEAFGEAWSAIAPGDGGKSAAPDDVVQTKLEIDGADPNRMLRVIVDLGPDGYVALGTAKRNHLQAHDQLLAIGFDRAGTMTWAHVVESARVTDILGAHAHLGIVHVIISVPLDDSPQPATALALFHLVTSGTEWTVQLADTGGWTSAGFIEGSTGIELLAYTPSKTGIRWQRLRSPTQVQ